MDSPEEDASQVIEDACKDFGTSIVDRIYDIAENEPGVRLEMFWKISEMMLFVSMRESLAMGGPDMLAQHIKLFHNHFEKIKEQANNIVVQ